MICGNKRYSKVQDYLFLPSFFFFFHLYACYKLQTMNILPTHLSKSLSKHLISYIFPKKFCSSFNKNRIYSHIYMYMFHRNFLLTLMKYFSSILVIAVVLLPLFFLWCLLILNSEKPCIDLDFSVQLQLIVIEGRFTRAR